MRNAIVTATDAKYPPAAYSRLLLDDFFDDQWERILYVEADMRVMARYYVQYMPYGVRRQPRPHSLRPDSSYFNAGLICFDWRVTTSSGLLRQAKEFAIENPHLCKAHDQDALNKVFEGAWAPLDPRWNFMTKAIPEKALRLDYPARFHPYISHFAGPTKPRMASFSARYEQLPLGSTASRAGTDTAIFAAEIPIRIEDQGTQRINHFLPMSR